MGKRPVGRPKRRWMCDIKIDLGEIEGCDVDWIFRPKIGTSGELS
jgi:hypothetical protein